jgi:hypothetical protein
MNRDPNQERFSDDDDFEDLGDTDECIVGTSK